MMYIFLVATQGSADCNFDYGYCQWMEDPTNKFNWTRTNSSTPSRGTGPLGDHSGHGYYIYIEASGIHRPGDKADLNSPVLPSTSTQVTTD